MYTATLDYSIRLDCRVLYFDDNMTGPNDEYANAFQTCRPLPAYVITLGDGW